VPRRLARFPKKRKKKKRKPWKSITLKKKKRGKTPSGKWCFINDLKTNVTRGGSTAFCSRGTACLCLQGRKTRPVVGGNLRYRGRVDGRGDQQRAPGHGNLLKNTQKTKRRRGVSDATSKKELQPRTGEVKQPSNRRLLPKGKNSP